MWGWGVRRVPRASWVARWLMVAAILAGAVVPFTASAATGRVVATPSVNIRTCPTLECQVIGAASLNDNVEITGTMVNGFYPVRWFGVEGWAYGLYLMPGGTAPWFVEGDAYCNRVAFVFNIGIGYTPSQSILNTLIQQDVDATMFPMGSFARSQPGYLRQLDDAGFVIGTHGDRNLFLTNESDSAIRQDVNASIAAIEAVIGRPMDPYFTPYAADTNNRVRTVVSQMGLLPVGWNIAANDYASTATESAVYSRIMNNVYPGAVIEFHLDGPATESSTARALPRIIRDLRAQGYEMATIPDMADPCGLSWPVQPAKTGTVTTGSLRCRTTPSLSGGIITSLSSGTRVTLRGNVFNGWAPVTCGGRNGWMSTDWLALSQTPPPTTPTPTPTTPTPTSPPITAQAVVSNTGSSNLRCRAQPTTSSATLTSMAPGTRVDVRGAAINGWVPIRCAGQNGWASGAYLTISGGQTPTPTPTTPTPPPTTPPPATSQAVVSNTGGANLRCRAQASTSSATLTMLAPGTRVDVRGATTNGWTPIRCAGQNGWASAAYLTISGGQSPTPTPTPPPGGSTGVVSNTGGGRLNCRSGPGTGNPVVAQLAAGATVAIRGATAGGWVPVTCGGQAGWVSAEYLRITS